MDEKRAPFPGRASDPSGTNHVTVHARRGPAWSAVTRLDETTFRVRLGGVFPSGWMATCFGRLAGRRISVDHAHARLAHDDGWIAEIHLLALPGSDDPMSVPYLELAEGEDSTRAAPLALTAYRLIESRDYGGTFMLTLEAEDTLGLLGSVLGILKTFDLFPIEMHIETRGGCAYDCFWLRALGGTAPSRELRDELDLVFASSVPSPSS